MELEDKFNSFPSPALYVHYLIETVYMHMFSAQSLLRPLNFPFSQLTIEYCPILEFHAHLCLLHFPFFIPQ